MGEYLVNVNFVKNGQHYLAGDKVELEDKLATQLIEEGKAIHPTLGDFLTPLQVRATKSKKKTGDA